MADNCPVRVSKNDSYQGEEAVECPNNHRLVVLLEIQRHVLLRLRWKGCDGKTAIKLAIITDYP